MHLASPHLPKWFSTRAAILTPSAIAASVVTRQFAEHQLANGFASWERPPIYSIDAWLVSCWQEARYSHASVPSLLSVSQELLLWQQIIEADRSELFDPAATARMARRSAQLLADWDIPLEDEAWNDHQDSEHFKRWVQGFRQKCLANNWIARSDLRRLLPTWIEKKWVHPGEIVFAGFEEWSPALKRVWKALENAKILDPVVVKTRRKAASVKQFDGFPAEFEQAARWARALFERNSKTSIAIVVPKLSSHRAAVERALNNVLHPSSTSGTSSLFHFSEAAPLSTQPLVASALLILELAQTRINHADACAILRSPFIQGAVEERSARAHADLRLRKTRELDVSIREIEWASRDCPILQRMWASVRHVNEQQRPIAELPIWSKYVGDLLEATGWPGDSELNPREQELVESWKSALSSLAALGMVSAPVSLRAAAALLRRILTSTNAELGDWFSPIQVLNPNEAAGFEFDAVFITGLSDEGWRPALQSSPLIPFRLQRQYQTPGSSPERVWETWNRSTRALFHAAPLVAGSYNETLSPIARPFVSHVRNHDRWTGILPHQAFSPADLEVMSDAKAPVFQTGQQSRGGAYVLKAQSACPFKAFAEIRLNAESPDEASFGFDSRDRGGFMHKGLELIWKRLESQERLRATPEADLRTLIDDCVRQAVHCDERDSEFHLQTTAAERERLGALIQEWLEVESRRLQPFTVETLEQQRTINIGGLQLTLRTDRIDRLSNGRFVLLDYKSGEQTLKKLQPPRPEEPQLLVYAAALQSEVDGIFFAQVKCGKLQAVGYSRDFHFEGKCVEVLGQGWPEAIAAWRAEVHKLASGFVSGDAAVDPKTGDTCTYCQMKPFCRIAERDGNSQEWS